MGLVRLTETQVDELNKQFLNEEVFADPEVLYYVWTPFFDSLSGIVIILLLSLISFPSIL